MAQKADKPASPQKIRFPVSQVSRFCHPSPTKNHPAKNVAQRGRPRVPDGGGDPEAKTAASGCHLARPWGHPARKSPSKDSLNSTGSRRRQHWRHGTHHIKTARGRPHGTRPRADYAASCIAPLIMIEALFAASCSVLVLK